MNQAPVVFESNPGRRGSQICLGVEARFDSLINGIQNEDEFIDEDRNGEKIRQQRRATPAALHRLFRRDRLGSGDYRHGTVLIVRRLTVFNRGVRQSVVILRNEGSPRRSGCLDVMLLRIWRRWLHIRSSVDW